MNGIPVLKSKLIMPELSQSFLLTDRLKKLHENMDSCRASVVCAPAGYGKTSLAVSYFHHRTEPSRICWYRLDPEDKNLSVFLTHLVEVVFPSDVPEFSESRKALANAASFQDNPQHTLSIICHQLWIHHTQPKHTRTFIVLDDFHNISQVQELCDLTRYMLDHFPSSAAIFILTRAKIDVFTVKQKLEKNILEIIAEDLSFNRDETENLMLDFGRSSADRKFADLMIKSTEGWIAGIIILYQAFKNKRLDTESFESGMLVHEEGLFRYLSMEVLKSVGEATQNALAKLALLQDFSETEAMEILEIREMKSLLEQCLDFGMFIQRIPGSPVVYRFHSLFREFLLHHLKGRLSCDEIIGIHLSAAGYYIKNQTYGRAAEHLTQCGNSESAMELITKAGFNKFMIGETGQLKKWLDLLPEEMVMNNPVLLLFKVQLMPNSRQPQMVDTLKKIIQLSLQDAKLETYYDAASVLIYILMCSNDMRGLHELTEGLPNERQNVSPVLDNMLGILDIVRFLGEDQFSIAQSKIESVQYMLLPDDSKWLYLILSCIVYYCAGKLENAERCMRTALILYSFKNIEPSRGFILLFLSIVQLLKNERGQLPQQIGEVLAIGEKYDYEYLSAHAKRLAAFDKYFSNDIEASVKLLDEAAFLFLRINNKAMAATCRLLRCLWSIRTHGSLPNVDEAQEDLTIIQKAHPGLMVYESSLSVFGAIAREAGAYDLAEQALLTAIKESKAKKGYQVLFGAYIHISRLYFAKNEAEQGHDYLKLAMALGTGSKYFMVWDIHLPTLLEMLLRSIKFEYCQEYVLALLSKFYPNNTVKYLNERIKSMEERRVSAFTADFLSNNRSDNADPLYFVRATLFGKPEIAINGSRIPDTEWKTKKVKGLLEYLLLESGNTVSKDVLTDVFWPDSDSKSAFASQRTALYNLRKVLTKYGAEIAGANAFIDESLEGLQIRRNDRLELDVHEFLSLYEELNRHENEASSMKEMQRSILQKMLSLYRGDLMDGSDYGDVVFHERERLRSIFIEVGQRLASIDAGVGDLRKAEETLRRVLVADPYNENICLELLKVYMSQGRRSQAVKLYYSFINRMEQELGIKADTRLAEVIRIR